MDHFGRLLKQANNNMMRHFDQFARQYDLTGNQMAIIDFITNHANHEVLSTNLRFSVRQRQFSYNGWRKKALSNDIPHRKTLGKKRLF